MGERVLMYGWEFPPHNSGGLGVACQGIVKSLARLGARITFVLPRRLPVDAPYADIAFADDHPGVELKTVNAALLPYQTTSAYLRFVNGEPMYGANLFEEVMRYAAHASAIAHMKEYDVIYAHDWLSFPAGLAAKQAIHKPLIVHVHSTEFDRCGGMRGANPDVYAIERQGMEEADRVIVLSNYMKHIIMEHYHIPASKITIVYNGIDDDTAPQPGGFGKSQLASLKATGHSIVLFLGRITLQKGLDHLLRAAKKVLAHNRRVIFLVSGSGDMERRMMEYAAELRITQHVLFTGFLRGAEQYEAYRLADLFVMPSVSEPFGIAALEAMKLGTPVLISKQSGVAEAVTHALKVDFWDTDELANKILATLAHAPLRATLAQNGAKDIERLSWMKTGQEIKRVIQHTRA